MEYWNAYLHRCRPSAPARTLRIAVAVVGGALLLRLLIVDALAPALTRSREFLVEGVTNGTTVSQRFTAASPGLELVHVEMIVHAGDGWPTIEAELAEIWNAGDRSVRRTIVKSTHSSDCCDFRFAPLENSHDRQYRIDLTFKGLGGGTRVSFPVTPVVRDGGLTLNGRVQSANLNLHAGDTLVARLPGAPRVSLPVVLGCFVGIDLALFLMIHKMLKRPPGDGAVEKPARV